jgi:hypothetical protein
LDCVPLLQSGGIALCHNFLFERVRLVLCQCRFEADVDQQ